MSSAKDAEAKVAVLADCDNTRPEVLEHALKVMAKFGRVVMRRGYGNKQTLVGKWQDALVNLAFTPALQYAYAAGKNTTDIALALDALEALLDDRAEVFCIVTSDSDFAHLCQKLRERGAMVYIVGEAKTPDALRHASDQFFEYGREEKEAASKHAGAKPPQAGAAPSPTPVPKQRPKLVLEAVKFLSSEDDEGRVGLGPLGQYLKRTDPSFTPKKYGHSGLLAMVKTYDLLKVTQEHNRHWVSTHDGA